MHIETFHICDHDGEMELRCEFTVEELRALLRFALASTDPRIGKSFSEAYSGALAYLALEDLRPGGLDVYYKHWDSELGAYVDAREDAEPDGIARKLAPGEQIV